MKENEGEKMEVKFVMLKKRSHMKSK